jgi:hypothetical protein
MPKIKRSGLPRPIFNHLLDRVEERGITAEDLSQMAHWLDSEPVAPEGPWFKRFSTFILCGEGGMVKTVLSANHTAIGTEM